MFSHYSLDRGCRLTANISFSFKNAKHTIPNICFFMYNLQIRRKVFTFAASI